MTDLRIAADDLTGALDAGAPFAQAQAPLPVVWDPDRAAGSFVLDTESRERDKGLLAAVLPALAEAELAYKKIDSLLRGRTAEEIALCLTCGRFRSVVIAPAFPDQQRITRGGRQWWRKSADEPWQPVATDLRHAPRAVPLRRARSAGDLQGEGAWLCDAATSAELEAIAAAGARLPRPLLWIGSAGLARALAGRSRHHPDAGLAPPLLVVVGSHHPVSLGQVDALEQRKPERVVRFDAIRAHDPSPAMARLRAALLGEGAAALVIALPDGTGPAVAAPIYVRIFRALADHVPAPGTLVVTGGATLMRLLEVLGAAALEVRGELMPGIACAGIVGGRWAGRAVVSKSGAFGAPDLLARLAAA